MKTHVDMDAYLERIAYTGDITPCEQTLHGLHQAHTLTIPFENLDVYYGKPLKLDRPSLFEKIVTRGRGGYCYEMNGLFFAVLMTLGFRVTPLLARVAIDFKRNFGPKTHHVLMVETDGQKWLTDVGFGRDGLIHPLRLDTPHDQHQFSRTFRLEPHDLGYVLDLRTPSGERCQYVFTLEPCTPADITMSNHYSATFPDSLFVNRLICTRPTPSGRITLTDQQLTIDTGTDLDITYIDSEADFADRLLEHFCLDLDKIKACARGME